MKLQKARKNRALTIRALAEKAGVSPRTIVQVEKGTRKPHFMTIHKVAAALDMSPGDIDEFAERMELDDEEGERVAA